MFSQKNILFIGAGGIGMSALVRYFLAQGKNVFGYDKTQTALTEKLSKEGAQLFFEDQLPNLQKDLVPENTLVIYTPAIPKDSLLLNYVFTNEFKVLKRSEVLGVITSNHQNICIAGTHGKTTISSMVAAVLNDAEVPLTAFLGGIANNFASNYHHDLESEVTVIEADEYDRSFLKLSPNFAVVTAVDPDHLDIYGTPEDMVNTFKEFITKNVQPRGVVLIQHDLISKLGDNFITYSIDNLNATYYTKNIEVVDHTFVADFYGPNICAKQVKIGLPGIHNLENSLATFGVLAEYGLNSEQIKQGIQNYSGVERRFDVKINEPNLVYIDDYAHHPEEITQLIKSVKKLYQGKKICGIFQPHLFSRTQDFLEGFASALSLLDELILLDIYPARELPIPGVDSNLLLSKVQKNSKILCSKKNVPSYIMNTECTVVLSIGAGDIGMEVDNYVKTLQNKLV